MEQVQTIDLSSIAAIIGLVLLGVLVFERIWTKLLPLIQERREQKNGHGEETSAEAVVSVSRCVLTDADARQMVRYINDLHDWHDRFDDDGVRVWYIRRSFYDSMERHNEELQKLTAILTELTREQRDLKVEVRRLANGKPV